jgi:hypothetical protein
VITGVQVLDGPPAWLAIQKWLIQTARVRLVERWQVSECSNRGADP